MLFDAENRLPGPLNKRNSRFTFVEITVTSSAKVKKARLPGGDEFSCFISTDHSVITFTFTLFLQLLLACLNLPLDAADLFYWYKRKK